jgi:hypothetical protein
MVQADAPQLRRQAGALQIRVSTQMDICAEHAGANQGDFDFTFHWVLKGHLTLLPRKARKARGKKPSARFAAILFRLGGLRSLY